MRTSDTSSTSRAIDFKRLAQDFSGLDTRDPGVWPLAPRVAVMVGLLAAAIAGFWWFDWQEQADTLSQREQEEVQLRDAWASKKRQAVNLDEHRRQLAEIDQQFGALLKQLPNRAEMDSLLSDINQAGLGRGLQFELFKPGANLVKGLSRARRVRQRRRPHAAYRHAEQRRAGCRQGRAPQARGEGDHLSLSG